jgi:hypothetical protein
MVGGRCRPLRDDRAGAAAHDKAAFLAEQGDRSLGGAS